MGYFSETNGEKTGAFVSLMNPGPVGVLWTGGHITGHSRDRQPYQIQRI